MNNDQKTFEEAVAALVKISTKVLREFGYGHRYFRQLQDAIAEVEAFDQTDDPRENGWVGSDGLP